MEFMMRILVLFLVLLAGWSPATHSQTAAIPPPLVDHHVHIASINIANFNTDPILPRVELPADLERLIKDREELARARNPAVSAPIYTSVPLFLNSLGPNWLQGEAALEFATQNTGSFPLFPVAYAVSDSAGFIAGTWTVGAADSLRHVTNFLMAILKGTDGRWRIAAETITSKGPPVPSVSSPEQLVQDLEAAGIRRGVVLSVAYQFGSPFGDPLPDELASVRAENDWVAAQVARFPDRLVGFSGVNPMKDYAIEEVERCRTVRNLKGIKLHFGNSDVDLLNPSHVEKVREFFHAANEKRLPIVVHLWKLGDYGPEHSRRFLDEILPAAPDIPIQIAHLAGAGPGYDSDEALEVFADAVEAGDPRTRNLYFDVASNVTEDQSDKTLALIARRIRQLGAGRVLFASDRNGNHNEPPKVAWSAFLRLPLTDDEFRTIATNQAPYLR
jgi:predicted TIM-barrel fold metal-dependent hydrolase